MAKTNWQDPGSSEIRSSHIAGLQAVAGKVEDSLDLQLSSVSGASLSEVYISGEDRYRIFQVDNPVHRNWAADPGPVVRVNGIPVSTGIEIDYAGGAVIFNPRLNLGDVVTADFSHVISNTAISDATAPTGDTGTVKSLLGWIAYMIKTITGKTSWRTTPATNLESAKVHMDDADQHIITTITAQQHGTTKHCNYSYSHPASKQCTGGDADTVDGKHSSDFVLKTGDTLTGALAIDLGGACVKLKPGTEDHTYIEFYADSDSPDTRSGYIGFPTAGSTTLTIGSQMAGGINLYPDAGGDVTVNGNKIWHTGNDGSGSTLDADTVDGMHSSDLVLKSGDTISGGLTVYNDVHIGTALIMDAADPYIRASADNKWIVLAGGNGSTDHGATIVPRGVSAAGNAGGIDFYGANGAVRTANFNNLNVVANGSLLANGFVGNGGALRLAYPQGASYASTTSTITGAIKITLPQSWTNTMMRMTVQIYEYTTNESFTVHCGGYNYSPSTAWSNCFAYIEGHSDRNFSVRLGHDGTYCAVYIGETSSTWSYPQVAVTEFIAGYSNYSADQWNDGWSVSFVTSLGTITGTISNAQIGRYVDGNEVWHRGNLSVGTTAPGSPVAGTLWIDTN